MDIVGPLPMSRQGNKYILVVVDYLSRYPEAIPMPSQEATEVADAFLKHIVGRWGVPNRIITDLGTNFQSQFVQRIFKELGAVNLRTSPYHPQTDGLVERYNRTLKATLTKLCSAQTDWEDQLPWAVGNFRFCVQASTRDSPYFLVTAQDPVLPPDSWLEGLEEDLEFDDWRYQKLVKMEEARELVLRNMRDANEAARMRRGPTTAPEITPGSLVLLEKKAVKPGTAKKLTDRYTGPYRVIEIAPQNPNVIKIEIEEGIVRSYNRDQLQPYQVRNFTYPAPQKIKRGNTRT
jgi:hypothetical protein